MDKRLMFLAMMLFPSIAAIDSWVKLSSRPVCFGAKNNQFGSFNVPKSGRIAAVKLIYLSGYVTCDKKVFSHWTFWGCANPSHRNHQVSLAITTSRNTIITPVSPFLKDRQGKWSELPGYNSFSPEIILSRFYPYWVTTSQELRLWYGEDLEGYTESDNAGWVCCNVYVLYV